MVTLISPLSVAVSSNKNWILNLNNYRNTHFQTLNKTKVAYKNLMCSQIQSLPQYSRAFITYTLYPKTKRKCDVSNICSVHDKYFCDALSELGKIPDDNYDYVPYVFYTFGEIDKDNPRVEIQIKELSNMQIKKTLDVVVTQADVEQAIIEMIRSKDPSIVVDSITFTSKRRGNETLDIKVEAHDASGDVPTEPVARTATKTTKTSKATKKEEVKASEPEVAETPVAEEPVPQEPEEVAEEPEPEAQEGTTPNKSKSLFS
jgi:hypothetical protein